MELPYNLEVEGLILNASIFEQECLEHVLFALNAEDFYYSPHQMIFGFVKEMNRKSIVLDRKTLLKEFQLRKDDLCVSVIAGMKNDYLDHKYLQQKVEEIKELSFQRQMSVKCNKASAIFGDRKKRLAREDALAWATEISDFICGNQEKTYRSVAEMNAHYQKDPDISFIECLEKRQEAFKNGISRPMGTPTMYLDIDKVFGGFKPGHLIIVGARPAVGKTTFMCNLSLNIASATCSVGIFSLEMESLEIFDKMILTDARINKMQFDEGDITGRQFQDSLVSADRISKLPIYVDDTACININLLHARAKLWVKKYGVKIVFVDYLQIIRGGGKFNSKYEEITLISQTLKKIAKDLKITVVCLAQLNRDTEKNARPRPSDLRDSGAIEQDADAIFLLHDPSAIDKYNKPGVLQVFLAKNRFGSEADIDLSFNKSIGLIANYSPISLKQKDHYGDFT